MSSDPSEHLGLVFFLSLVIGVVCAFVAVKQRRSPLLWLIIGVLFGIFALLFLLLSPMVLRFFSGEASAPESAPLKQEESSQTTAPPPASEPEDKVWYYLNDQHEQFGPVSLAYLQHLWDQTSLTENHYVWSPGMEKWQRIRELGSLKEQLSYHKTQ